MRIIGGLAAQTLTAPMRLAQAGQGLGPRRQLLLSVAVNGRTVWDLDAHGPLALTGGVYTITPLASFEAFVKAWGGGGGAGGSSVGYPGGCGGYAEGRYKFRRALAVSAMVAATAPNYATGQVPGGGSVNVNSFTGGGGGGYSGLLLGSRPLLIAGGAGGGGWGIAGGGGPGGGADGGDGIPDSGNVDSYGGGARGHRGGKAGVHSTMGEAGSALQGSNGQTNSLGGNGGGGYYGGGSGGASGGGASGGGGSGFLATEIVSGRLICGTATEAGNATDADRSGAGDGAGRASIPAATVGNPGRLIIR